MKKSVKITLWVLGSLVTLIIALFLCADIIASRLVNKEVKKSLANLPDVEASVGGVYLNIISGSAIVTDITFSTNSLNWKDSVSDRRVPGLAIHVPKLEVWNIHYWELFRNHRLVIQNVSLDDPIAEVYLDEKNPESILPTLPKDTTLHKANEWLQDVELRSFNINRFSAHLHSTHSPLHVQVDSLSLSTKNLAYDFMDSLFTFNDSVYELNLEGLSLQTPDGMFAVELHDFRTEDQGPIELGYTRLRNLPTPKQIADRQKEPITWIDMELNKVTTSALNPIRKAFAMDCTLDAIDVDVKRMHVYRDSRYKPKSPYGTPQDFLRKLPVKFCIKQVNALARKIDVEFASTDINCGIMHIKDGKATLTNITNKTGAVWRNVAHAPFGEEGKVEASYTIRMDKSSSFDITLDGWNINTADLNSFIRPLVGITSECHIDRLDAAYSGDWNSAKGEFCMQYHGLNVKVHKEDNIPYEIVKRNADVFTNLANSLVPKSNPTSVDPAPRRYYVEWKRDEWKPYPLYLFGPSIDGIKKTMLPGLYVHKQVSAKKPQ